MNKRKYYAVLFAFIALIQACDPNKPVGLKNNSKVKLTIVAIKHVSKGDTSYVATVLPNDRTLFNMTAGKSSIDTNEDILFEGLKIIRNQDTMTVLGKSNLLKMFEKEPHGGFYIVINDTTKFH